MEEEHEELKELVAAYALGALPAPEEAAIRSHILTCDECLAQADSYAAVASSLLLTVEPQAAPQGFSDRILARVAEEAPRPVVGPARSKRWSPLLVFSYAALVLVAVVLGVALVDTREDVESQEKMLAALLRGNGVELAGREGAAGRVVPTSEGALLVVAGLPRPPRDRTYQLWLIRDGRPSSAGTFEVSEDVTVVESDAQMRPRDEAAVTLEPRGGSRRPTTRPLMASA